MFWDWAVVLQNPQNLLWIRNTFLVKNLSQERWVLAP